MKLIRFGERGQERAGIQLDNGQRKDVSAVVRDWDAATLANAGIERLRQHLAQHGEGSLPDVNAAARTGACVARPGKIIGIGLNYRDHAAESGAAIPTEPVVFLKATTSYSGPNDPIGIPSGSAKVDYEVELGVVIGFEARRLASPDVAPAVIAGYCVVNDVSERALQLERGGGQWTKGKGLDSFCPTGPWLVTPDEVGDPQQLKLRTRVNGEKRQSGRSADMIFGVHALVHHLSWCMTLEPGDLVCTGTPAGVGMGARPPRYLAPGDIVELEVEKLGRQRQQCVPVGRA